MGITLWFCELERGISRNKVNNCTVAMAIMGSRKRGDRLRVSGEKGNCEERRRKITRWLNNIMCTSLQSCTHGATGEQ